MPIAVDPRQPWDYVLKAERNKEISTKFHLRPLTCGELATVEDNLAAFNAESGEARLLSGTQTLKILRMGLVGWSDFYDAEGKPVEFQGTRRKVAGQDVVQPDDITLDRLVPADRREIAEAITEQNRLTDTDRKN